MATEFVISIGAASMGRNYTSWTNFQNDATATGTQPCNLTTTACRVFTISAPSGTVEAGDFLHAPSGGTGYVAAITDSQIFLRGCSGSFGADETLWTSGGSVPTVGSSDTVIVAAEFYDDDAAGHSETISESAQWTTNATNYLIYRAATGHKHNGYFRNEQGYGFRFTGTINAARLYSRFEDIVFSTSNANCILVYGSAGPRLIKNCILRSSNGAALSGAIGLQSGHQATIVNCVFQNNGLHAITMQSATCKVFLYNSTIYGSNQYGVFGPAFVRNCIIANCGSGSFGGYVSDFNDIVEGSYNITTDAAAGGSNQTNGLASQSLANIGFLGTPLSDGVYDFHINAASVAVDFGEDLSSVTYSSDQVIYSVPATDMDGNARIDWDAGAFENTEVSSHGTTTTTTTTTTSTTTSTTTTSTTTSTTITTTTTTSTTTTSTTTSTTTTTTTTITYTIPAPSVVYTHNTNAQSGDVNPGFASSGGAITDTTPVFSSIVGMSGKTITKVQVQVSKNPQFDDSDIEWDSGWKTLSTPIGPSGADRHEDIEYGL